VQTDPIRSILNVFLWVCFCVESQSDDTLAGLLLRKASPLSGGIGCARHCASASSVLASLDTPSLPRRQSPR
jgi:hypothetical protein